MRGDIILKILINFLAPFLILAGFLTLYNYKIFGFFAFLVSGIYFINAYILYYVKYGEIKINTMKIFQSFIIGISIISIGFLLYIMLKLTNFF
jgi:hypothetical protein